MRAPGAVGRLHASCTSLSGVGTGETANVPAAISVARADSSSTNVAIGNRSLATSDDVDAGRS